LGRTSTRASKANGFSWSRAPGELGSADGVHVVLGDGREVSPFHEPPGDVVLHLALKRCSRIRRGTLPGRKPGRRTCRPSWAYAAAKLGLDLLGGHLDGELALDGGQLFDLDLHGSRGP
jgi:hypothetical protein